MRRYLSHVPQIFRIKLFSFALFDEVIRERKHQQGNRIGVLLWVPSCGLSIAIVQGLITRLGLDVVISTTDPAK